VPDSPAGTEASEGGSPVETTTAMPPEFVRNSPEYQELQRQLRAEARRRGSAEADLAKSRAAEEQARQAAEASIAEAREREIRTILGDDGVAAWSRIAEQSATDPVAAARTLAELMRGQQATAAAPPAPTSPQEGTVTDQASPPAVPAPPSGLSAATPLGSPSAAEGDAETIAGLERQFADAVDKVQNPLTRNRVRQRDIGDAFASYVSAALMKAGVRPKP
jgi:hypothetical protein